jgi:hypothetical protein
MQQPGNSHGSSVSLLNLVSCRTLIV